MYPSRGARAHEADQYERENEERMGQLHNRITNLKNVRQTARALRQLRRPRVLPRQRLLSARRVPPRRQTRLKRANDIG